ncbi:oxidoreductase [[Pantoea] beijingensis]|uniref:Oxidoreductase n=1 Tax=[Pantoea] beijingensis TaxID=1324864 RepID=A0A443IHR9_9GAMM|nr:GMC family oxidoreductase N-terminal domain-containing protein [[Pantoea] beijingensis]RWR03570.1 oxidoreductase [[Pantoea] beijingensis]
MSDAHRDATSERAGLQPSSRIDTHYDFIICGAGSSGSVIARRLAENPEVKVLLLEAGHSDDVPPVMDPALWPTNLGSDRDWKFLADANPHLNGRTIPMSMGKVLGGGSSINVMVWARGHKNDWDFFASEADDDAWGYDSVLTIYRNIENWLGAADPQYRGTGGPVYVQPSPNPSPIATAMLSAAQELNIPVFSSQNGLMMEGEGGCAITDVLIRDGKRNSIFRAYTHPILGQSNLTVLTDSLVTRLIFEGKKTTGVEFLHQGVPVHVYANAEVILSLGAVHTPKVLLHSGIGDRAELNKLGIPLVQHLPGVGQGLQDHISFGCIWEYKEPIAPRNSGSEATLYWKSSPELTAPDLLFCQAEFPVPSNETAHLGVPEAGWSMFAGLAQPKSRGRVYLTSANPLDSINIDARSLSHPDDMKAAINCIKICRELGNATAFSSLIKGESMPGNLTGAALENYIRNSAVTYWHQTCTAKMGRDDMAVVDNKLSVYGIENLRIADGSIMPRVTTGNTMAPCVIIGERASAILKAKHQF